jgi:hypothetical protein
VRFLAEAAYTAGLDLLHRFGPGGSLYLRSTLQGTHVSGDTTAISRLQRSFMRYYQRPDADHVEFDANATELEGYSAFVRFARESEGNFRWGMGGALRSPGFEIGDLGFQFDADFKSAFAWVGWEDYQTGKTFRRKNLFINTTNVWDFGNNWVHSALFVRSQFRLLNHWDGSLFFDRTFGGSDFRALRGGPALRRERGSNIRMDFNTDRRKTLVATLGVTGQSYEDSRTFGGSIAPGIIVRPSAGSEFSIAPSIGTHRNPAQFIASTTVGDSTLWVIGRLQQTTAAVIARASYTFSPKLSLQAYAQPFVSAAGYDRLAEVRNPQAARFADRFMHYADSNSRRENNRRAIDRNGDGVTDFTVAEPDFTLREINANAVLRWEYRPGSTAFFVWSHGRSSSSKDGTFDLARDANRLFELPSRNTFLVKFSYWIN